MRRGFEIGDEIVRRVLVFRGVEREVQLPDVAKAGCGVEHGPGLGVGSLAGAVGLNDDGRTHGSHEFRGDALELAVHVDVIHVDGADAVDGADQIVAVVGFEVGKIEHAEVAEGNEQADGLVVFHIAWNLVGPRVDGAERIGRAGAGSEAAGGG